MAKPRITHQTECAMGDIRYLRCNMIDESQSPAKRYIQITECIGDRGATHISEALFRKTRHLFGPFIEAFIVDGEIGQYLVLKDRQDNELHLTGCTAGYTGTGPNGTLDILKELGFEIDLINLIFSSPSFRIMNPKYRRYTENPPGIIMNEI